MNSPAINRFLLQYLTKIGCLALLLSSAIGCGHTPRSGMTRGDTTIVATLEGTPLQDAQIDLTNTENGEAYGGKLNADGSVTISDVAIGSYVVTVLPPEGDPPLPGVTPEPRLLPAWKIPRHYQRPESTPIRAEVIEGMNNFEFELTSQPTKRPRK